MSIITYLTTIRFEAGAISGLAAELARLGIARPLVVTDKGLMASGLVEKIVAGLGEVAIFDGTPSNPTEAAVLAALELYRQGGHDGIVAVGGGSSIDLAKGVALLATHSEPLVHYAAIEGGVERIGQVAPLVAVPTTAGTGSEVGRAALITLADGRKVGLISPHLIPRLAVCDPELTLGLPPKLTAATGMDAITHCIETYLSPRYNPPADAIALDGLRRGIAHIETAVAEPGNLAARTEMLMSALQGGLTFQKGLGAVHGLSHALGSLSAVSMHHGMLNAILLPAVLRFNEPAVAPERWAALCEALSCPAGTHPADHVAALVERLGLPTALSHLGYTSTYDDEIVGKAMQDHSTATNPRALDAAAYRALLGEAM